MNPNKALWEKGDFSRVAIVMRESAADFVSTLGIEKGMDVLDLACGDGNTAIPEAKLGANVLGVDIATNLIEAAKLHAQKEGVENCTFQEGDATDLHNLKDGQFDFVVTVFGAMFAPKPLDVAKEMVRVTKPGGKIVMGNWIPGDPTLVAQILKISSAYTPPPPEGFVSPMLWGVESHVTDRFFAAGIAKENITCSKETFVFRAPYAASELLGNFKNYYGPTMNAFEAAGKEGKADKLQSELELLFESQNTSTSKDSTLISVAFLKVTVNC